MLQNRVESTDRIGTPTVTVQRSQVISDTYVESSLSIEQVRARPGVAVLEFGAPWCGICAAARPALDAAFAARPTLERAKVWDGPGKALGRAFQVKLWPTLVLLRNGREVDRLVRPDGAAAVSAALDRLLAG